MQATCGDSCVKEVPVVVNGVTTYLTFTSNSARVQPQQSALPSERDLPPHFAPAVLLGLLALAAPVLLALFATGEDVAWLQSAMGVPAAKVVAPAGIEYLPFALAATYLTLTIFRRLDTGGVADEADVPILAALRWASALAIGTSAAARFVSQLGQCGVAHGCGAVPIDEAHGLSTALLFVVSCMAACTVLAARCSRPVSRRTGRPPVLRRLNVRYPLAGWAVLTTAYVLSPLPMAVLWLLAFYAVVGVIILLLIVFDLFVLRLAFPIIMRLAIRSWGSCF